MVARVTTYRGQVEQLAGGLEQTRQVLRTKPGSLAVEYLLDSAGGVGLIISFWSSPEAAEATAEWAQMAREQTCRAMDLTVEDVRVFDVVRRAEAHALGAL